ncbi:hypothetical protein [Flavobacterium terrigena]|uniref:Lipoprotein n=1 Tax=Flavobacterium terrigena TaxID=402734 RepID=A0A1H6VM89_9FLAO|nr:hypothetical protein [Flavobacterium terrigena]SEJ01402.1 hypothetical protein SAMN05660918_2154 [Flavobacterium terrigena]
MSNYIKLIFTVAFVSTTFVSCKNEEQEHAKRAVEEYNKYVDSISRIADSEALANWESIQIDLDKAKAKAEVSLERVSDKKALQSSVDKVSTKYDAYKNHLLAQKQKEKALRRKNTIRTALFGEASLTNDMKFEWVNKRNILTVYEDFIETIQENKYSYSREDWDEIKALYEALDSRKNEVEKEGLSNSKNNKIALLKMKFGPMYAMYRLGAKSDKNVK